MSKKKQDNKEKQGFSFKKWWNGDKETSHKNQYEPQVICTVTKQSFHFNNGNMTQFQKEEVKTFEGEAIKYSRKVSDSVLASTKHCTSEEIKKVTRSLNDPFLFFTEDSQNGNPHQEVVIKNRTMLAPKETHNDHHNHKVPVLVEQKTTHCKLYKGEEENPQIYQIHYVNPNHQTNCIINSNQKLIVGEVDDYSN